VFSERRTPPVEFRMATTTVGVKGMGCAVDEGRVDVGGACTSATKRRSIVICAVSAGRALLRAVHEDVRSTTCTGSVESAGTPGMSAIPGKRTTPEESDEAMVVPDIRIGDPPTVALSEQPSSRDGDAVSADQFVELASPGSEKLSCTTIVGRGVL
jgi:hypothetical protein